MVWYGDCSKFFPKTIALSPRFSKKKDSHNDLEKMTELNEVYAVNEQKREDGPIICVSWPDAVCLTLSFLGNEASSAVALYLFCRSIDTCFYFIFGLVWFIGPRNGSLYSRTRAGTLTSCMRGEAAAACGCSCRSGACACAGACAAAAAVAHLQLVVGQGMAW